MLVILQETNKHKHGCFLAVSEGLGFTSPEGKDKHQHQVVLEPILDAQEQPVLDEQGQPSLEWIVKASGDNPHTHDIGEIVREEPKKKKKNDDEVVAEMLALIKEAEANEMDSIENGKEAWDFYMGEQWDPQLKKQLEADKRAAITINEVETKVDILCGTRDQNKVDVVFRPVENSDEIAADVANMVYKSVLSSNKFHQEEGYSFKDQTIAGRGCKTVELDFNDNPEGDIKIRWFPWDKVRLGPHERPDQEDLEYLIKFDNFSLGKLVSMFPKKEKDIRGIMDMWNGLGSEVDQPHQNIAGQAYRLTAGKVSDMVFNGEPIVDVQRKEFRVFELWQKIFRTAEGFILSDFNFVEDGDGFKAGDVRLIKRIPGVSTIKKVVCDIRKAEMAGGVVLSDEILDLPVNANQFHLICAYGKKHKNGFKGKVESAKGPQMLLNKTTSQSIDIVNKMASYGYFYDDETFWDGTEADNFRKVSSQAGFLQRVKDASRPPAQAQGVKFPSEVINMKQVASQDLNSIMGIPPSAAEFSGDLTLKMHMLSKRQSLVGNDFLFENANMANRRIAKLVIAYVQEVFSVERIMRIMGSQTDEDINDLSNPNVINATPEQIQALLDNEELLKLDLVMSESAHTDTMKELTFMSLQEVLSTVGGDPTILKHWIKNSPFPNKTSIIGEMEQQQQASSEQSSNTNDSQNYAALPDSVKENLAEQGIFSYKDLNEMRAMNAQQQQAPPQEGV